MNVPPVALLIPVALGLGACQAWLERRGYVRVSRAFFLAGALAGVTLWLARA